MEKIIALAEVELPSWKQCHTRVLSGGYSVLEYFIYHNEPAAPNDVAWRNLLTEVLAETINEDRLVHR